MRAMAGIMWTGKQLLPLDEVMMKYYDEHIIPFGLSIVADYREHPSLLTTGKEG